VDNGNATSYFFRDDERIAKQTSEGMEWYLSDHLGSTTVLINETGLEVERTEYYPYGQVQSGGLEKYGFTGQENDADTELMYYGARYYSPEYRVFVQPDSMIPDPYNPQYLNRYAYVLNNPVKYTDPTGHLAWPAALVGGVFAAVSIWFYYDFTQDLIAWNQRDPSVSTNKLMANAFLTLPLSSGGIVKVANKAIKHRNLLRIAGKEIGEQGFKGALKAYGKGLSPTNTDIAKLIAVDGPFVAGSFIVNQVDTSVDSTIVENTNEGTRLGDAVSKGRSTTSGVSLKIRETTTDISDKIESTKSEVSKYVSNSKVYTTAKETKNKVSTYVSGVTTKVVNKIRNFFGW